MANWFKCRRCDVEASVFGEPDATLCMKCRAETSSTIPNIVGRDALAEIDILSDRIEELKTNQKNVLGYADRYTDEKTAQLGATINAHAVKIEEVKKSVTSVRETNDRLLGYINDNHLKVEKLEARIDSNEPNARQRDQDIQAFEKKVSMLEVKHNKSPDPECCEVCAAKDFLVSRPLSAAEVHNCYRVLRKHSRCLNDHGKYQNLVEACKCVRLNMSVIDTYEGIKTALEELGVG